MSAGDGQRLNTPTILVVEDDPDTREFMTMLLDYAGYQTVEAASGSSAIIKIAEQPVQAVTLDLRLPDMDGLTVCHHLREHGYPEVPIILITADRTPLLDRQALEAGVTTMISKPFAPNVLLDQLTLLLPS